MSKILFTVVVWVYSYPFLMFVHSRPLSYDEDHTLMKEVVKRIFGLEQAYKIMPQKLRLFKVQNLFDNLFVLWVCPRL